MNIYLKVAIYALIFILLYVGFFLVFKTTYLIDISKRNVQALYSKLISKDEKRVSALERERREYGALSKNGRTMSFLAKRLVELDDLLIYSGLSISYAWLNTTTFLTALIVGFIGVVLLCNTIFTSLILAFVIATISVFLPIIYMKILRRKNYKMTESKLTTFVDVISNSGMTSGNIAIVLEEAAITVPDPIRRVVFRATTKATATGDYDGMIDQMCREIEHPIFGRFIRNLYICSRNDAAFNKVAREYTQQLNDEISEQRTLDEIHRKGTNNAIIFAILAFGMILLLPGIFGSNLGIVITEMTQSVAGVAILIVELLIFGGTGIYCLKGAF